MMKEKISIEFVSDISCLWCAIGYKNLEKAINNLELQDKVEIEFQPFELNPNMTSGGQNLTEHLAEKYGNTPKTTSDFYQRVIDIGNNVGFKFALDNDIRIYNTFDAHRILYWAKSKGKQVELKLLLFKAYLTDHEDPGNHDVILRLVEEVGLDPTEAKNILTSSTFVEEVKEEEQKWRSMNVEAVPSIVFGGKYMLQGAVPVEFYENVLTKILLEENLKDNKESMI